MKKVEKFNWMNITKEDVIKAIKKFLELRPEYPQARSTFLIYNKKKLPAKHIRGMAYKEHYGVEISKEDFTGGKETVKFFERLGFEVEYSESSVNKADVEVKNEENLVNKIIIPSKGVIEQKNALQLILNKMFKGDIVCEKTYSWLKTPEVISGIYKNVFDSISSYRGDTTFAKKNVTLRCDFVCEGEKLIIEYDERQHFSEARRLSLESYKDIDVYFDKKLWIKACKDVSAKDNIPVNRDEVRAYYDSTRDIACNQYGYKLVRIMHGQIDFRADDAYDKLQKLLSSVLNSYNKRKEESKTKKSKLQKEECIKVAMYLQTEKFKNKKSFERALPIMKSSEADIIVFPEHCYVPERRKITSLDISLLEDQNKIYDFCLKLSEQIGKAVIVSSHYKYYTIFSIFANAKHLKNETKVKLYIKHTMCHTSCFDFQDYTDVASELFKPIIYKGYSIGMTICYDCNHALFSRIYGMYGVDLIINSTGGNVIYDKWFKYNKVRAIENNCYILVTMGGDDKKDNNYVLGFNKNGGLLYPKNPYGDSSKHNNPGGLYLYEVKRDAGKPEEDYSNKYETDNKNWQFRYKIGQHEKFLKTANKITDNIFRKRIDGTNVFFLIVEAEDIFKPEVVQKLLYAKELKKYSDRRYILINKFDKVNESLFKNKLSIVLKVRAMENYCAVILVSENINKCYQSGQTRTVQVVKAINGYWKIDLNRTSGPETIWKDKDVGMKASWRTNYEWLVENVGRIYN